ncbi:uncharacterized protein [Amphiura filiformis]|uniref:uncharacterized protein n=1 Tax=Amphiura filiformis TaxID=82378 RepID=UPI003B212B72
MGTSESKHIDESQRLDTSHPSEDESHMTPPVNKRLMKLTDPRSPTDGVDRTPIVAEKPGSTDDTKTQVLRIDTHATPEATEAPDPRSPSCNVARTPQPFTFDDPRSPSGAVARTPFIPHEDNPGDPRSPTPGIDRTPFVKGEQKEAHNSSFECLVDDASVQENLNSSNNNIDIEDSSVTEPDSGNESQRLIKKQPVECDSGLTQIDTPQYEAELSKMVEQQTLDCDADDVESQDSQEEDEVAGIIYTDASEHKTKTKKHKKSLKDKVQQKFHGGAPRSPLSTRNLLSDSPSLHMSTGSNSVIYVDKANTRRRHTAPTPTRLVGRYEPILDKENV